MHIDVTTMDNLNANFVLDTNSVSTATTYTLNSNNLGGVNLDFSFVSIRTLLVYPLLAKNYGLTVLATDYILLTAPYTFSVSLGNYNASESVVFMGLD